MSVHYFTVFDKNYAARGLLMLDSLCSFTGSDVDTHVLALDDDAFRVTPGPGDSRDAD